MAAVVGRRIGVADRIDFRGRRRPRRWRARRCRRRRPAPSRPARRRTGIGARRRSRDDRAPRAVATITAAMPTIAKSPLRPRELLEGVAARPPAWPGSRTSISSSSAARRVVRTTGRTRRAAMVRGPAARDDDLAVQRGKHRRQLRARDRRGRWSRRSCRASGSAGGRPSAAPRSAAAGFAATTGENSTARCRVMLPMATVPPSSRT